ncbi:MAG: hypothetical protein ACI9UA_004290 [Pseudoalteromonas tetraodonis]|jgi:hypothetical protein
MTLSKSLPSIHRLFLGATALVTMALVSCATTPQKDRPYDDAYERSFRQEQMERNVENTRLWQENSNRPSFPQLSR